MALIVGKPLLLALDDLTDVTVPAPSSADVLTFNGSEWVNAPFVGLMPTIDHGALSGLSDDDHSQYVYKTTGSFTRNTITAMDAASGCLRLREGTGGLVAQCNLFAVTNNAQTTTYFAVISADSSPTAGARIYTTLPLALENNVAIQFKEATANGGMRITMLGPASLASNFTHTLAAVTGTTVVASTTSTTLTHAYFSSGTAGGAQCRAIATGDLPATVVYTNTTQTISGAKTFSVSPILNNAISVRAKYATGQEDDMFTLWSNNNLYAFPYADSVGGFNGTRVQLRYGRGNEEGSAFVLDGTTLKADMTLEFLAKAPTASQIPLTVRGTTSQSGDLQRWQNVTPTTLARIDSAGKPYFGQLANTVTANVVYFNTGTGELTYGAAPGATGETSISLTADVNNQALSTSSNIFRFSGNAEGWAITGFANGAAGREVTITNVGSYSIKVRDESASSTAANRVSMPIAGVDLVLRPGDSWTMIYDNTSQRWRVVSGHEEYLNDIEFCPTVYEDFMQGGLTDYTIGQNQLRFHDSGGTTSLSYLYNTNQMGSILATFSAAAAGYMGIYLDNQGNMSEAVVLEARVKLGALGDGGKGGGNEFGFYFGAGIGAQSSVFGSPGPNDGIAIGYDSSLDGTHWLLYANSSATTTVTGPTITANTWYRLKLVYNTAQSSLKGWVNETLIGTITTNLPSMSGNDVMPMFASMCRIANSPSSAVLIDYMRVRNIRTSRR